MRSLISKTINSSFEELRRSLNIFLIRTARLDLDSGSAAEISLGEILGRMDAISYLILLLSLGGALVISCWFGMFLSEIRPEPTSLNLLGVIPGVVGAVAIWTGLFRLKHYLSTAKKSIE
jgi:hypothetical protein